MNSSLALQPTPSKQSQDDPHMSSDGKIDSEVVVIDSCVTDLCVLQDERDVVEHIISVDDDPSLSPWTLRAFIIGISLSVFGGALAEIYYFKPQTLIISTSFLGVISYVFGISMEAVVPRYGWFRHLNPGPFNIKENGFIFIMASSAGNVAMATEVLATRELFYGIVPKGLAPMFLLTASQFLGYAIAGLMRPILVYPSKMLYPSILPLVSLLDAFHSKRNTSQSETNKKRLKLFLIAFLGIFLWELFPQWIFPLLTGFSVFCLANPTSHDFTRIFGGSNGNEGLGLFSLCFDWLYISPAWNPFAIPLRAQFSILIGYILCIIVFVGVYYNNVWASKSLPFLSQDLFYENGTVYNQTLILNDKWKVDPTLLAQQGLPYYAGTWVTYLLCSNVALSATLTHLLLWNRDDLRAAWTWMNKNSIEEMIAKLDWRLWKEVKQEVPPDADIDPHYREMLKYSDTPNGLYSGLLVLTIVFAVVNNRMLDSTLPWWGLIIAVLLAAVSILFFGAFSAMTGISFIVQPFLQMIGGFLLPGKPMANMFFVLYSYNSVTQAQLFLRDMKLAQYTKVSPRAMLTAQVIGTFIGANLNFFLMSSILLQQRHILVSVEGTNAWSGQQVQQFNSQAIAWGGFSHELFAFGKRYQSVTLGYILGFFVPIPFWLAHRYYPKLRADYLYTPLIALCMGMLAAGINSSALVYFAVAWVSQWFLRTRRPKWFAKYNYILGAALDGGTDAMVFLLSLAVQGAVGKAHLFPKWWGANQDGNYDRCAVIPS